MCLPDLKLNTLLVIITLFSKYGLVPSIAAENNLNNFNYCVILVSYSFELLLLTLLPGITVELFFVLKVGGS